MVRDRGGWVGGGGVGGRGGWEARGGLNLPLGLFALAMGPRSASHRPKHAWMVKEMSPHHWDEFQIHAFHVAPPMGPIVLVMNLQGW